jgi:hypothetical protein
MCHDLTHYDVAFAQHRLSLAEFEEALQSVVDDYISVQVLKEVIEYTVPEDLTWLCGLWEGQLMTEYRPAVAYLVRYTEV